MIPLDIKKRGETHLQIIWDDDHNGLYEILSLRKSCPCASCRSVKQNSDTNPLNVLSNKEAIPHDIAILKAEMVGRYALQFNWSDGHHEGIYSFEYLRKLCQCETCRT
ncbi:DUF971 domain-containing protein [bacterium]|nr:DUF971 domain-containing protein [bacterium]